MAATKSTHDLAYRILGAVKVVAENKKIAQSLKHVFHAVRQLKAGLLGLRSYMTGAAGGLVAMGLALNRTVSSFAAYSRAQATLRTTLAAVTESYRNNARIASSAAEPAAIRLGYSTTEATEAMNTMVQTGIGVHASMRLIGTSLRLARIGEMETSNATRFLVDTMNMFRSEMARDDLTMRQFAERMTGQLAVAANMSSTSIENLQQAFRYAGTELSAVGYESNEVMSALAGLSVVGLRSTTSGTRLRGAIAALVDPAGNVREQITRLTGDTQAWANIVHNEEGNLRRLPDMMAQLMAITARTSSVQERNNLMFSIFGRRSFAAGASMATYNRAAQVMLQINEEISDDQKLRTRQMNMEEERMRGFHMQVQQLKHGLDDLAISFGEILFGAMTDSREGFGTYVREVARAIRLIGMINDGNDDMREEFNELSPRVRETAAEVREFMINLAWLLKNMVKVGRWVGKFIVDHPYLTAAIMGTRIAFGGFIPILGAIIPRMASLIATFRRFPPSAVLSGQQLMAFNMIAGVLAIDVIGRLTSGLQGLIVEFMEAEREMEEIHGTTTGAYHEWARGIPIIGSLAAQYVELAGAIERAWEMYQEVRGRRQTQAEQVTMASASDRVRTRYAGLRRTHQDWSAEQLLERAVSTERSDSVQRMAMLLHGRGRTGAAGIRQSLQAGGMTGDRLEQTVTQIQAAMRNFGDLEREQASVIAGNSSLEDATLAASRQLAGFDTVAEDARNELFAFAQGLNAVHPGSTNLEIGAASPVPVAQDAYVNRGGLMGVSSGDIVVSRRHLANAVLARQGAMAGPAVSMANEGSMVGPAPTVTGGGGGGSMNITIPVMLDGREIARAVGRQHVSQLERGGGRLPPGQRRSLRETGFSRVV